MRSEKRQHTGLSRRRTPLRDGILLIHAWKSALKSRSRAIWAKDLPVFASIEKLTLLQTQTNSYHPRHTLDPTDQLTSLSYPPSLSESPASALSTAAVTASPRHTHPIFLSTRVQTKDIRSLHHPTPLTDPPLPLPLKPLWRHIRDL